MHDTAILMMPGQSDLTVAQTTVATVCIALIIWAGLLARPGRPTLYWTLGYVLALLGSYASLAALATGTDVERHPIGVGLAFGMPLLIWSGIRAANGRPAYPWAGVVFAIVSTGVLAATTSLPSGSAAFRVLFLLAAATAAMGAVDTIGGIFTGTRFGAPLVAASALLVALSGLGIMGIAARTSPDSNLAFVRAATLSIIAYLICALVTGLFVANRRMRATEVLDDLDALLPVTLFHAIVRERLLRADLRHEGSWSFIDLRLDDARDLHEAIGETAFGVVVQKFEQTVKRVFPSEADLGRGRDGQVLVFVAEPSASVREHVRTVLNEIVRPRDDTGADLRTSVSAGIVAVNPATDTYDSLASAASDAVVSSQKAGGDRWTRTDANLPASPPRE